jgi:hypothetical protein
MTDHVINVILEKSCKTICVLGLLIALIILHLVKAVSLDFSSTMDNALISQQAVKHSDLVTAKVLVFNAKLDIN